MKYKPAQYAEALALALEGADRETVRTRIQAFIEILKKHQMLGKAEDIVRMVERRLASRAGATCVILETADAPTNTLRAEVAGIFGGTAWIEEKIRPKLLAGVRVLIDDETLVDASGKRRLAEMFRT